MTQYSFSTGTLILKRTDVANTQPALMGTLQDNSIEFDRKIETLLGQYNMAVAVGAGEFKISGKAKFARLQATQLNNLFLGPNATQTTALNLITATGETDTVTSSGGPASGIGFTVTNGSTFVEDLGVFTAAGVQLTPVASGPVAGVSYVPGVAATGAYGFASGDENVAYTVYYRYTTSGSGNQTALANALMGPLPMFELNFQESFTYFGVAKILNVKLNACFSPKLSLPFAMGKFNISELDWQAIADSSNNIGYLSTTE
jgi:hypothetical protein